MKIAAALAELQDAESALAAELQKVGERHRAEQDVFHLTRTMSGWVDARLHRLAPHAEHYAAPLDPDVVEYVRDHGTLHRLREKGAELIGRRPEPGLLLLHDLRDLHLAACRVSLAWTVLGQGAQAVADAELLATVTACHPEAIRTMKWTVQKAKEASPQVLAS
ncbi:MAG: hypothetical protein ITG02_05635 [Patulibacter sp.]|nr:hypothetical protein [Patulibacter sp.]